MRKNILTHIKEDFQTGFSKQSKSQGSRLVNKDGTFNVRRIGLTYFQRINLYNELILLSWTKFTLSLMLFYFVMNLIFGMFYYLIGIEFLNGAIAESKLEEFLEAFFFSTQTFATVGYGRVNPSGLLTNFVASIESLFGVLSLALVTSLLYSRFAKPNVKLKFSKNILIAPYKDIKAIMLRFANTTNNQLLECEIQLMISFKIQENGKEVRKFIQLPLEIDKSAALALSWTVVHPLNENSPLVNFTKDDYLKNDVEFIFAFKAHDSSYSQTVFDRYSYQYNEMVFDAKFLMPFYPSEDGFGTILDLSKIGLYEKL